MLLLICEIAHSQINFKLPNDACKTLFMNRGRNVSHSHHSNTVAPNHSLRGALFSKKKEKNFNAQH